MTSKRTKKSLRQLRKHLWTIVRNVKNYHRYYPLFLAICQVSNDMQMDRDHVIIIWNKYARNYNDTPYVEESMEDEYYD